jgi:CheY-like chemotaxis protein
VPQRGYGSKKEFDSTLGKRMPLRILVAEDVPVNQQMMQVMLSRMAYAVDFAANGVEALRAVQRRHYDLVFMDMQMPEMDGLECSREMVALYPGQDRPKIVALTANVSTEVSHQCMAAGMDDFLAKPLRPVELRKCLERWGRELQGRQGTTSEDRKLKIDDRGSATENRELNVEDAGLDEHSATAIALIDYALLADLRELDGEQPGLLQSFVKGFLQAVPEHTALMRQALVADDGERLRQAAHRLKGTAANVAACRVAEQCQALEKLGRSGALSNGPALILELEIGVRQTSEFFEQMGVRAP